MLPTRYYEEFPSSEVVDCSVSQGKLELFSAHQLKIRNSYVLDGFLTFGNLRRPLPGPTGYVLASLVYQ
jgi:hypothetical protein